MIIDYLTAFVVHGIQTFFLPIYVPHGLTYEVNVLL